MPKETIAAEVKKPRKRKKKLYPKSDITDLTVCPVRQDETEPVIDEVSKKISSDEGAEPVTDELKLGHAVESPSLFRETELVVQTLFPEDSSSKYTTDNASMSSLSMSSMSQASPNFDTDSEQKMHSETPELPSNDELSFTSLSSSSSFVECTKQLSRPLSYANYPFLEYVSLKLAKILHEKGYQGFVFGGVVYRQYSLPSDVDIVTPDFMSVEALQTLETPHPDPALLDRIKMLLRDLEAQGITAIGFNPYLKIPGYQRGNRYMLPLCVPLGNGMVFNADLTLFSGGIEAHAQRDLSLSALYYDPIHQKMYSHTSFDALKDLKSRLIRPISEPIALMRGSPKLIFNFIRLHVVEGMRFDASFISAFFAFGQQQTNVFLGLSDISLQSELMQLDGVLDRQRQFVLFWELGLFHLLYHRLLPAPSPTLALYRNEMQAWFGAQCAYQQQIYTMATMQQFTFYGSPKRKGSTHQDGKYSAKKADASSASPSMR